MATAPEADPTPALLSQEPRNRTGQTFTYPATSRDASREIARLKNTRPSSRTERRIERKLIADQIAAGPVDAARVRERRDLRPRQLGHLAAEPAQDPPPAPDPCPRASAQAPKVGQRTELARYTVAEGERIIYGQRIEGVVSFLPGSDGVVDQLRSRSEDATCSFRQASRGGERPNALRDKRLNADVRLPTGGEAS